MSAVPPNGIFISYRRSDAQHAAGRLADALERALGESRVFRDLHDIGAGQDFVQVLDQALDNCATMLVLIGSQWLAPGVAGGLPRLHEAGDWVRREVETALARGLRVIPVLLELTPPPQPAELPPTLANLMRVQAVRLIDSRWDRDVADLVALLQPAQAAAGAAVKAASPLAWPLRMVQRVLTWAKRLLLAFGALVVGSIALAVSCTGETPTLAGDWHSSNGWRLVFRSLGPSKISTQAQYQVSGRFEGAAGSYDIDCQGEQVIASVKLACQALSADGRRVGLRCEALRFQAQPPTLQGDCLWQPDDTLSRVVLQRR